MTDADIGGDEDMSSEDRPGYDRPGHDPSGYDPSGYDRPGHDPSGYDPLSAPLPSEVAAAEAASRTEPIRTDVVPRARADTPVKGRPRRVAIRRLKRTLRHVDPISILKLSLFFYACFLVLWLIVVAIIYSILDSMGLFTTIENFTQGFAIEWDNKITLFFVERWAFLIGLTFVVIGSLINMFVAFLYNVAADTVGGVEMTFVERDL